MSNDFLSDQQAASVGGAENKAGATGENTFQNIKEKQLVVFVKPGKKSSGLGDDLTAAGGLISGVTDKIDGAVSAIEDVASSIPGLDLFIKEKKVESASEKEYCTDFSAWEKSSKEIEKKAKEILDENTSFVFGFEAGDAESIKKEGQNLKDAILEKLNNWKDYSAWVHIIGIDKGGLVMNECSQLLASDSTFQQEKWMVRTAFSIGSPTFLDQHRFNPVVLKGQGKQIQVFNKFDLTQQVISCFEPSTDLVKYITNSNSNLLKLTTAKLKMRVIRIIASLLKGVTIGTGAGVVDPIKKLVNDLQSEIGGLIDDLISMIDEVISGIKELIDLKEIPDISQFTQGFENIPNECKKILSDELTDLLNKIEKGLASANLEVGLSDLTKFFNCLCPLVDHLTTVLKNLTLNPTTQQQLAKKLLDKVNIQSLLKPGVGQGISIDISSVDPYTETVNQAQQEKKPDKATTFISTLKQMLFKVAKNGQQVAQLKEADQQELADVIYRLTYPMLTSKKQLIEKLMSFFTGLIDLKKMMNDVTLQSLASAAGGQLKSLYLSFPPEKLALSIQQFDSEFNRVKNFFKKREYDMRADTLYLMYNSHNLVIKSMSEHMAFELDTQMGYVNYMHQKGYGNTFLSSGKNSYEKESEREIKNVLPTKELPETNNA
jgi:hypothetical protein